MDFGTANGPTRGTARTHDDAGPLVRDLIGRKAAVHDRLIHRDMAPSRSAAMEAHRPSIDHVLGAQRWRSVNLRAKAELSQSVGARDSRPAGVKARGHFLRVVSDRGHDAHARDNNAPHSLASTGGLS
jgi:hypothetical protein